MACFSGYGHIAPATNRGKIFCVFCALFGIPLTGKDMHVYMHVTTAGNTRRPNLCLCRVEGGVL